MASTHCAYPRKDGQAELPSWLIISSPTDRLFTLLSPMTPSSLALLFRKRSGIADWKRIEILESAYVWPGETVDVRGDNECQAGRNRWQEMHAWLLLWAGRLCCCRRLDGPASLSRSASRTRRQSNPVTCKPCFTNDRCQPSWSGPGRHLAHQVLVNKQTAFRRPCSMIMLRAICQSAQFVRCAAQFRNRACAICKFLT